MSTKPASKQTKTNPASASDLRLKVVISWLFVGIPLLIGVVQTILKSLELFR